MLHTTTWRAVHMALLGLVVLPHLKALAEESDKQTPESWNLKFQSTYVRQFKSALTSPYSGTNSLSADRETSYSFTSTLALGMRLSPRTELYINPEAAQGVPLSGLTGLGGFTNGEIARTAGSQIKVYRARAFLRHTIGLGGGQTFQDSDMNQLAGFADNRRWVFTVGNMAISDIFDDNRYSHDPRTQFLNWTLMNQGAFDYAADARGYSWGAAVEWYWDDWAVRAGRFIQPQQPNQQKLDRRFFSHFGDQIEIQRNHSIAGQPGAVRALLFRNRARMGRFEDALVQSNATGQTPDLNTVRAGERIKYGVGLNMEQAITDDLGLFARAGVSDGKTEVYAFTEVDKSVSGGLSLTGQRWGRPKDTFGLAGALNGLSKVHRQYLAAGGLGFFVGDGRLNYGTEQVLETYYSWNAQKNVWFTANWQQITNPAYNKDRGPARVASVRLHTEF